MKGRHQWLIRAGIVLWWAAFSLIAFGISTLPSLITGRPPNLWNNFVWHSAWMIWGGLSFLAIFLARRFPVDRNTLGNSLLRQFFLGFAVVIVNVVIEFSLATAGARVMGNPLPSPGALLASLLGYKFHINLVIYWAIVGITNAYDYYQKYRRSEWISSQLETKLTQAELQALKSQLQPHFLFNTHHAIISLMLNQKNEAAIKMLTQLSDLLRITLQKNHQQFSSLKEELETLDLYLGIQTVRFADRLDVQKRIDPQCLHAEVPYLLLQPLVENAIRHGIDHLPSGGKLQIIAEKQNRCLVLAIIDNGPGRTPVPTTSHSTGIGLTTTRSRLSQLYGEQASFDMHSHPEKGTEVSIRIPFRTYDQQPNHE